MIKIFPKVVIIILNWNGWEDTIECLDSVYQITYPNFEVIVADNGSENESIKKIKDYTNGKIVRSSNFFSYSKKNNFLNYIEYSKEGIKIDMKKNEVNYLPSWKNLILINNGKNLGFSEGNNIAIKFSLKKMNPEYILLLNNDTVVDKEFLGELVKVAESDKKIGFVGPKTYYYDYHGRKDVINFAGGQLVMWKGKSVHIGMNEIDQGQYDKVSNVDFVEGSCILASREAIESIGYLDSSYFLYYEEIDWCMRAKKAGFRMIYAPKAIIWHKVAASQRKAISEYYKSRNRLIFTRKFSSSIEFLYFLFYFIFFQFWQISCDYIFINRDILRWKFFIKGILSILKLKNQ